MNIKLTLAYDGTDFHGWQKQENVETVEGTLLTAIRQIMADTSELQGVSRTDAGVHALEYVANFHTKKPIPIERMPTALNSHLPETIRVYTAETVSDDWNSRFNCSGKTYVYRIFNAKIMQPHETRYSWHFPNELNIEKMRTAAKMIVGTHDFSCFCAVGEKRENRIRTINWLEVDKTDDIVSITINADAYLYNMVRIIVGTLAEIGSGKIETESIPQIIESRNRILAGRTAPAKGLFLQKVHNT